ncbi:MAG: peptidylprolyl isomerase [Cycloclasticus sp. symbiont of Poecilosclerida sp. N]|nr:MAG: peptidylprolyl isomerase [Cycloclasticus sp. symbiont of Poecilosclerida sp. N]
MKLKIGTITYILLLATSSLTFAEDNPTIATVNGHQLKQSTLQFYALERRRGDPENEIAASQLIDDIIDMQLLKEEAQNKGLGDSDEFKSRMNFIRLNMLSQAAMINFLDNNPISEKLLKKEYNARLDDIKVIELKASHILLEEEAKAKEVIEKLSKGASFADLAKQYSTGPTGPEGGDLGWFTPQRMVPEFSEAVMALKDGEHTKQAVRTQFGWHIILRTGQRAGTPPSFQQIKPRITAALEQQHIQEHINELREKADIKLVNKSTKK